MGYTSIVWIYRDGIDRADDSPEEWKAIAAELGDAVLQVCIGVPGQSIAVTSEMMQLKAQIAAGRTAVQWAQARLDELRQGMSMGVRVARVGSHSNSVHHCDEVHSNDVRVYMWSGNRLAGLSTLTDSELSEVATLLSQEQGRRKAK